MFSAFLGNCKMSSLSSCFKFGSECIIENIIIKPNKNNIKSILAFFFAFIDKANKDSSNSLSDIVLQLVEF